MKRKGYNGPGNDFLDFNSLTSLNQCSPRQYYWKNQQRYAADLFKIDEVEQNRLKSCSFRFTGQLFFVTSVIDVRNQYQTKK